MKILTKLTTLFAPIALLAGCASTGGVAIDPNVAIGTASNVGMAVFQTAVDQKCRSELTANQYYKLASIAMTDEQKTNLQTNVCGCVSQSASQNVNVIDLATAASSPTTRTALVTKTVSGALQTCVGQFVK
ncbi:MULTISPECIES: hypothetical protein [unclassified Moraxella]|uniref:hypothetical protein n=1 Tax=unclassified Moraxella TaxID=2685852 RepID=UPI003AF7388E